MCACIALACIDINALKTDFTVMVDDIGLDNELQCVGGHRGFQSYLNQVGSSMQKKMGFNASQLMKPQFRDYLKRNSKCENKPGEYDLIRIGGHSLGGAISTLVGTFSFLDNDLDSVSGNVNADKIRATLDRNYWSGYSNEHPFVYTILNALFVAALNPTSDNLDRTTYSRIQVLAMEAPPIFGEMVKETQTAAGFVWNLLSGGLKAVYDQVYLESIDRTPENAKKYDKCTYGRVYLSKLEKGGVYHPDNKNYTNRYNPNRYKLGLLSPTLAVERDDDICLYRGGLYRFKDP